MEVSRLTQVLTEALRYMGAGASTDPDTRRQAQALLDRLRSDGLHPRWLLHTAPLQWAQDTPVLQAAAGRPSLALPGRMARQMLRRCHSAAILVCTMGAAFERLQRMKQRDALMALMLDACGSALVEQGCDHAAAALAQKHPGAWLTDRFSPGYGDLPLTLQPALLSAVDAFRRLGVQATESCMLLPQKTVTAIIGLSDQPQPARIRGCACCALRERCAFAHSGGCALPAGDSMPKREEDDNA